MNFIKNVFTPGRALFALVYTAASSLVILAFFKYLGVIAGLFSAPAETVNALNQLAFAQIFVPFWIPLAGAAAMCLLWKLRSGKKLIITLPVLFGAVVVLAAAFSGTFLLTKVNNIPVHTEIGILLSLLNSGIF